MAADGSNQDAVDARKLKRKAVFLSSVGLSTFSLLSSLCTPDPPEDKSLPDLLTLLQNHFEPKQSVMVARYKFVSRRQMAGEAIVQFVAELRTLARKCAFGDLAAVNERLRDQLVCTVADEKLRELLLQEEDTLSFDDALKKALAFESAHRDAQTVHEKDLTPGKPVAGEPVHRMQSEFSTKPGDARRGGPKGVTAPCPRCGSRRHASSNCPFQLAECYGCHKVGHLRKMCRSSRGKDTHTLEVQCTPESEDATMYRLDGPGAPLTTQLWLDGHEVSMEIDTGAAVTVISTETVSTWSDCPEVLPSSTVLRAYGGSSVPVVGKILIPVSTHPHGETKRLEALVVDGQGPNLLGRNWLQEDSLQLDWKTIFHAQTEICSVESLKQRYKSVFDGELGLFQGPPVKLYVTAEAKPKFCRARPVPYAIKSKVGDELQRLEAQDIISAVQYSDWASPIVPVVKSNGSIRICGDYKSTVNPHLLVDSYPLPRAEDIFASLTGGVIFTKLDLSQAYSQLALDEESKKFTTIATHQGLFQYNRLVFGVSTAPGIFQRTMETVLQGIDGVLAYLDDILVCGSSQSEHDQRLAAVLARLQESGLRCNRDKCEFGVDGVEYLGFRIDGKGLHHPTARYGLSRKHRPLKMWVSCEHF